MRDLPDPNSPQKIRRRFEKVLRENPTARHVFDVLKKLYDTLDPSVGPRSGETLEMMCIALAEENKRLKDQLEESAHMECPDPLDHG